MSFFVFLIAVYFYVVKQAVYNIIYDEVKYKINKCSYKPE